MPKDTAVNHKRIMEKDRTRKAQIKMNTTKKATTQKVKIQIKVVETAKRNKKLVT